MIIAQCFHNLSIRLDLFDLISIQY